MRRSATSLIERFIRECLLEGRAGSTATDVATTPTLQTFLDHAPRTRVSDTFTKNYVRVREVGGDH